MQTSQLGETKLRILRKLRDSSTTASALSKAINVNKTAIRTHLEGLEKVAAVEACFKQEGRGRPKKYFKLTSKGKELFPRKYELLLSMLLNYIVNTEGLTYGKKLLSALASRIAEQLVKPLPETKQDQQKTERLDLVVKALDEMGFEASREQYEGKPAIISRNCIVHQIAEENHDLICHAFHDKLIERALPGVKVELRECMAESSPYCRHVLHPASE